LVVAHRGRIDWASDNRVAGPFEAKLYAVELQRGIAGSANEYFTSAVFHTRVGDGRNFAMVRFLTIAIVPFLVACASPVIRADEPPKVPRDETIDVPSLTLTTKQFLDGDIAHGAPVTLTGDLRTPNWNDNLPVVLLLHGSGGPVDGSVYAWRNVLEAMGIATFHLDSFTGRGIDTLVADQSQLNPFAQVYDTYRAIDVLAVHPRIDSSRIAVMGFSRGGLAALYTSMTRFQKLYGPASAKIAAHLPFYPQCNIQLVGELDIAIAPIRLFHGAADNWNLASICRDLIGRLSATGKDVLMIEYPGAHHSFEDPTAPRNPAVGTVNAQNPGNCRRREEDGQLINIETGKPFSYKDACMAGRATRAYDKAAAEAAQSTVNEFLAGLFRLN
jgi:dienelactone hydrolase